MSQHCRKKQFLFGFLLLIAINFLFSAPVCAMERYDLQMNQFVVAYGQEISMRYYNASADGWIGIYRTDSETGEKTLVTSQQIGVSRYEGSMSFETMANQLIPDTYTVEYYRTKSQKADEETFEVVNQSFYPDQRVYSAGENGFFYYDDVDAGNGNWIGVFPADAVPSPYNSLTWAYLPEGTERIYTGEFIGTGGIFTELAVGDYQVCLFEGDAETPKWTETFSIRPRDAVQATYTRAAGAIDGTVEGTLTLTGDQGKLDDYYWVYWGNESGLIEDYLPAGVIETAESTTLTMLPNQEAPEGATRLYLFEGSKRSKTARSVPLTVELPDGVSAPKDALITSFAVMTDIHVGSSQYSSTTRTTKYAMNDIERNMEGIDFVITLGDVVNNGNPSEYKQLRSLLDDYQDRLPTQYFLIGNHDLALNKGNPEGQIQYYLETTGMPSVYYSFQSQGCSFIVLGSEGAPEGTSLNTVEAWLSQEQLDWLEKELEQAAAYAPERPIFVFLHQPLQNTVPDSYNSMIVQDAELREILSEYPQVIFMTGHSHHAMDEENVVITDSADGFRMVHAGGTSSLWDYQGKYTGSQGCLVEVYTGYVRIRARDYGENAWMGSAQYVIYNNN